MLIKTDKEGREAVQQLCDVALKQGGLQNLNAINTILNSISDYTEPEPEEKKRDK